MRLVLTLSLVAATLLGAAPAQAGPKLASLFAPDMLDVRVQFLETITGPARRAYRISGGIEVREYVVDRCQVTARVKDGNVRAYGLRLTKTCTADLTAFVRDRLVVTPSTTIGSLSDALGGAMTEEFLISCLGSCGNAADPTATYRWFGARALNFIEVAGTTVIADDRTIQPASQWADELRRREGEDYVLAGRFNCEPRYQEAGLKLFRQARLSQIVVGFDVADAPDCKR